MVYLHNGILHSCDKEWDSYVYRYDCSPKYTLNRNKAQINMYNNFDVESIQINIFINT